MYMNINQVGDVVVNNTVTLNTASQAAVILSGASPTLGITQADSASKLT